MVKRRSQRTTAPDPAKTLLDLNVLKTHVREHRDTNDALLALYMAAAETHLDGKDGILGLSLRTQGWTHTFESDYLSEVVVPYGPIQSVDSVTANGEALVLDTDYFYVEDHGIARICLDSLQEGPLVVVTTAGYGDDAEDVPADLRAGAYLLAADLFEHRTIHLSGAAELIQKIPMFDMLVDKYSRVGQYHDGWS